MLHMGEVLINSIDQFFTILNNRKIYFREKKILWVQMEHQKYDIFSHFSDL